MGCSFLAGYSPDKLAETITEKKPEGVEEDQKEYADKYEEENKGRFTPQVIITDILKQETTTNIFNLEQLLPKDKNITLGFSDYDNETTDTTVIDLAVILLIKKYRLD